MVFFSYDSTFVEMYFFPVIAFQFNVHVYLVTKSRIDNQGFFDAAAAKMFVHVAADTHQRLKFINNVSRN